MKTRRMTVALAGIGLGASFLALGPAATAQAGQNICTPNSKTVSWVQKSSSYALTNKVTSYDNPSGGKYKVSRTLKSTKKVSSDWSVTAGGKAGFSIGKVLGSLDASLSGSYTHKKETTKAETVKVTQTLTKKGRYYFYSGRQTAKGTWQGYKCDRGTKWIKVNYGTAKSFGPLGRGVVRCGEKVSTKSMAYAVKKKYC
ncbi:hypothetical protein ABZV64_02460 [Streptomyces sp. NPDC004959]|uniref:hypothetical protein n=2 Tax=Streptomyces TaxID=1883 RepID=UPI00131D0AC7